MCNRHELPPYIDHSHEGEEGFLIAEFSILIEHEVPGIVSKRIKRRDLPLDNADPIDLDPITEGIFKGLRNALCILVVLLVICWGLYNLFGLYQNSKPILAMGDWSQQ